MIREGVMCWECMGYGQVRGGDGSYGRAMAQCGVCDGFGLVPFVWEEIGEINDLELVRVGGLTRLMLSWPCDLGEARAKKTKLTNISNKFYADKLVFQDGYVYMVWDEADVFYIPMAQAAVDEILAPAPTAPPVVAIPTSTLVLSCLAGLFMWGIMGLLVYAYTRGFR